MATRSPMMPPPMASRTLSVSAWVTIWRGVAPTARRTAVVRDARHASEEQVRHVGTSDEKHQSAHGEQNLQAAAVLLFHHSDAGSGGMTLTTCFEACG